MKVCPTCNRTYANDEFAFCLADGTLLSAPYDSEKTQLIDTPRHSQLKETEILPSNESYEKEEAAKATRQSGRRKWDEESFLREVHKHPHWYIAFALLDLYKLSKEIADKVDFGTGTQRGSFNVKFNHISPKSLYTVYSDGTLELNFAWLRDSEKSASVAEKLGQELKQLPGFIIPDNFRERYITVKPEQWSGQVKAFIKVIQAVTKHEN